MSYGITMMSNVKNDFDAIIAGGGMIGAAVAIGLAQEGLRVAMIERQSPAPLMRHLILISVFLRSVVRRLVY